MSRLWLVILTLGVALAAGCGPAPGPGSGGEAVATVELGAELEALALEAYGRAMAGPDEADALRRALDQVELALAAPAGPGGYGQLRAAESALVARIMRLDEARAGAARTQVRGEATPAPGVAPTTPSAPPPAPTAPPPVPPPAPQAAAPPPMPRPTAQARPPAPAYVVGSRSSFEGSGNSGQYASCIDVQILGIAGVVGGAVIGINNGEHSFQDQTDGNGYAGRCGLGASTWSVVLFWTPGGEQTQGVATTVYVNGSPEQRAVVIFKAITR